MNDQQRRLTGAHIIALTVFGEARGEAIEGQVAVANVIRNRRRLGKWGPSFHDVCLAPWQFSCWMPQGGAENHALLTDWAQRLIDQPNPEDALMRQCLWIAQGLITDAFLDNTGRSTHYHAATMNPRPRWAIDQVPRRQLAGHLFYGDIA